MRILKSIKNALTGISHAWKTQPNFRIQVFVSSIILFSGILLEFDFSDWVLIISLCFAVIISELINTAVELVVDLIYKKKSKRAQLAKDVAAAAVLLISVWSVIIGIIVFYKKVF